MMELNSTIKLTTTMRTQNTPPAKETFNDSFFTRKSIISDVVSNNDDQQCIQRMNTVNHTSHLLIPVTLHTLPAGVTKDTTIDHQKKNSFMRTFIPKSGIFAIALLIAGLFFVSNASGQDAVGDYRSNATNFNWSTAASWQVCTVAGNPGTFITASVYPGQNTGTGKVLIQNTHTVNITATVPNAIGSLVVGVNGTSSATLTYATGGNYSLTVTGNVNVDDGTFNVTNDNGGTRTNTLTIGGNLTVSNTTTFDMTSTGNDVCNITFNGTNHTISGSGTYDFSSLAFSNSGTVTVSNSIGNISGTMSVGANSIINPGASVVFNSGGANGTVSGTGKINVTIIGNLTAQYQFSTRTLTGLVVDYGGTGAQDITTTQGSYGNLITSGSGTKTTGGAAITVIGVLTVRAGTNLANGGNNVTAGSVVLECGATTGSILSGGGNLVLNGNVTVNSIGTGTSGATISSGVSLGGARTFTVADDGSVAADLTISGVISTSNGLTKDGAGTMVLSATNTYSGSTAINAGVLNIQNAQGTGTTAGGVTVASGAALQMQGGISVGNETLSLTGTGIASDGALRNISGTNTWGGTITLATASIIQSDAGNLTLSAANSIAATNQNLTLQGAGNGTVSGTITTGSGTVTKAGAGAWTLSGVNTFTGGVTLNAGTLNINNASALGNVAGTFTINGGTIDNTSGANITTSNYPLALNADFAFSGSAVPRSLSLGTGAVTISANRQITVSNGTLTIGGIINDNTKSLTKAGAGTLSFGGQAVTLNSLTISAGTFTSTSGTMSLAGNFTNNATFSANGGTVVFNGTTQSIAGSNAATFVALTIANGSTTTGTTAPAATTFTINNGGKYIHSAATAVVPGTTKVFGATSIYEWQGTGNFPSLPGTGFGHLIINSSGGNNNASGNLTSIQGNLIIQNTGGGGSYTLAGSTNPTLSIGGNLQVEAGEFDFTNGTGVPVVTVTGNVILNGGILRPVASGGTGVPVLNVAGDWTNNGGTYTPGSTVVNFNNTSVDQNINGTATTQTFNSITVSKTAATKLIIGGSTATVNAGGTLTFPTATSGIIVTTASHMLSVTNSASNAIQGGGVSSYINGPLIWTLPSNLVSGSSYNFPVGNTSYLPFSLVDPTTGAAGATATVNAVTGNSGGSFDGSVTAISATEYWTLVTSGDFTNSSVSLGTQPTLSFNAIAGNSTGIAGTYASLGGNVNGSSVTNSNAIGADRFFVLATVPTALSVTALTPTSTTTTYGAPSANMTFDVTALGIVGGVTVTPPAGFEVSSVFPGTSGFGNTATAAGTGTTTIYVRLKQTDNVGSYSGIINVSGAGATTQTLTIDPSQVTKAALILTITAHDQHKTYGSTLTGGPGSTAFMATGLQNGNEINSVTIAYGSGSAAADLVNTYVGSITASAPVGATFDPNNYTISYVPGNIIVDPKALTITGVIADNKQYDGNTTVVLHTGSAALSGVEAWDELNVALNSGAVTGVFAPDANAANGKTVTTSGFTISGPATGNYTLIQPTTTANIIGAPLTVTATGPAKTYGTALTTLTNATNFTATATGVGSEMVTTVTLTPDAAGTSTTTAAGATYIVTPSAAAGTGGFLAGNYNITYVPFTGTVSVAPLIITANNVSKIYGSMLTSGLASGAFTFSGLVAGNTLTSVTINYGTGAAAGAPVATYTGSVTASAPFAGSGFDANNYNITFVPGNITVTSLPGCNPSPATIWSEPFTYAGNPTTGAGSPSGITTWSTSVAGSGGPTFNVNSNQLVFTGGNNATSTGSWVTTAMNLSAYTNIAVSINLSETSNLSGICNITCEYSTTNGVSWTTFTTNGSLTNDFTSAIASTNIGTATSLLLRIRTTLDDNINYIIDNVTVTGVLFPSVSNPGNQIFCPGTTPAINFTGGGGANTFIWTNSNTSIGLAANGGGNIPSFTAVNTGTTPVTANISVLPSNGTCSGTAQNFIITVNPTPVATFNYSPASYCQALPSNPIAQANPFPVLGGQAGTFTATAGLVFVGANPTSSTTGQVNIAATPPGTYTVTNTIAAVGSCPQTVATSTITIVALPTATISYTGSPFCVSDATEKSVTQTGQAGGTYTYTPGVPGNVLAINNTTGAITPSGSVVGTYTVTYTFTDGTCSNTTTTSVSIGALPVATFSYSPGSYCQVSPTNPNPPANPSPVFSGGGVAGTFTAPSGLIINAATGQVNRVTSTPGTYTVTNTVIANGCTVTSQSTITILALPTATISYSAAIICTSSAPQSINKVSSGGFGSYSATPAGLTINGFNEFSDGNAGQITPATSLPGTYTVSYTFTDGVCSNTVTTTVTIEAPLNRTVAAVLPIVCTGSGTSITVASSVVGTTYELRNTSNISAPAIASAAGTGATINLSTGALTSTTTFYVLARNTATGCYALMIATPIVTVREQPTATAGGSQTICSNGLATVSGATSSNGTIVWTHNGTGNLFNNTLLTPTYEAAAGDGGNTVTLTMTVSNSPCIAATAVYTIHVTAIPVVTLSTSSICLGSSSTLLSPVSGGTWISNNPSVATVTDAGVVTGVGAGSATFTFTNSTTNCSNTTSALSVDGNCQVVTLTQPTQLAATISGDANICYGLSSVVTVAVSGGTAPYKVTYNNVDYTGSGPIITFVVTPTTTTTYDFSNITITDAHSCTSSITGSATVTVIPKSTITLQSGPASQPVCIGSPIIAVHYAIGGSGTGASITLGALPAGVTGVYNAGVFTISGVPTGAGIFNYTITATGPCNEELTGSIAVNALPTVSFSGLAASYCIDASSVTLTGNHLSAGTFSGAGITDHLNGTATFSPLTAEPGIHNITYTYTDGNGCTNYQAQSVTVNALPIISCPANLVICLNTLAFSLADANLASPAGGTFSGAGVTDNIFNPATAGVGPHTINYFYTDGNGCSNTCMFTITVTQLVVSIDNTTESHCVGYQPTPLTATVSGGIPFPDPMYFYQWQLNSVDISTSTEPSAEYSVYTPPVLTTPGTYVYRVLVYDQCNVNEGGLYSSTKTIIINALPVISEVNKTSHNGSDLSCATSTDGELTIIASGATPLEYSVDNGTTYKPENVFSGLPAGTYQVVVKDINGCTSIPETVSIVAPATLTIGSITKTNVSCYGGNNGAILLGVTGGTPPYSYDWKKNGEDFLCCTTPNLTGLFAGTYTYTITDKNNCAVLTGSITVTQPEVTMTHTNVACNGTSTGSATVTLTGAVATSYQWDDISGQTTATASNLAAGTYHVTITYAPGCVTIVPVTITEPAALALAASAETDVSCYNGSNGTVTAGAVTNAIGNVSYSWKNASNAVVGTTAGVNGLPVGTYTLTVTDNCFTLTNDVIIGYADHTDPVITNCPVSGFTRSTDAGVCNYTAKNGEFNILATDNCLLTYTYALSGATTANGINNLDEVVFGKGTTVVVWTVSDGLHTSTCTFNVTVNDTEAPAIMLIPADITVSCTSDVPAVNYAGVSATDNCSGLLTVTHQDQEADRTCLNRYIIYRTYTVTDISGKFSSATQTITVFDNIAPVISVCPASTAFCHVPGDNYTIGVLAASDNCSAVTVTYQVTGATTRNGTGSDASGLFNEGVSIIAWTVKDACNNTTTCTTTVTVYPIPPTPVVLVVNNCGTSTLSTTAAGSLLWSTGATTSSITVNDAATYTVTSKINGCTSPEGSGTSAPITRPPAPVVTVVNHCDGSSTLSTTATGTLLWSNFSTGQSITVFTGGTYSVTQSNSCYTSLPGFGVAAPVFGANAPAVSITQPTCSVPTGTITVTSPTTGGGLTYSIDGENYQQSTIFGALAPGSYYVTVKTAAGCLSPQTLAVINAQPGTPSTPVVTVVNHCDGTSTLSTTASGNLSWSTGSAGSSITVSNGGTYSVTQTVNGCTSLPGSGTAAPNTTPIAPIVTITQPNCSVPTGTISVTVPTGTGMRYSIDGINYQLGKVFSGLAAGIYEVTAKTAAGCISSQTEVEINAQPGTPLTPVVTVVNNCNGTSTLSTTAGGSLSWSTGSAGTSITVVIGGTYSVTQTVNGCTSLPGFGTASPYAPLSAPAVSITQPTCAVATGTITITAPTGSGLTYSIDGTNYQPEVVFSGLAANSYNVTVKNAGECISTITTAVVNGQPLTPAPPTVGTITQATCALATGSVVLNGLPAGSWTINPGGIAGNTTSATINGLAAGIHSYTVTTAAGCTSLSSANVVINAQQIPTTPTIGTITQPTCALATGSVVLNGLPSGGWTINPGAITGNTGSVAINGLAAATYNFTVTNAAGCTSLATANVVIDAQPGIPSTPVITVVNHCNGTSTLSTTAGGSLSWSTGASGSSITVNNGGSYSVIQTVNGCTSLPGFGTAAPNTTPAAPAVNITQPTCSLASGTIEVSAPTGTGFTYSIDGNNYQPGTVFSGLAPNSYIVTAKNAAGCISSQTTVAINTQPGTPLTPVVTVVNNCNGTSILSTIATGSLSWSTGASGSSITVNNGGSYSVTQTVNGCTSLPGFGTAAPNTTPAALAVNITQPTCSVATGTITITAPTGSGLTYSIDGTNYQPGLVFSGLTANSYDVTAKNAAGCISTKTTVVISTASTVPAAPIVTVVDNCSGTSVLSTIAAGNLLWSTGATGSSITVSNGGSYSVTQTVNGCTSLPGFGTAAPKTTPAAPAVTITQPTCSVATGTITVTAPTGSGLTYSINGINYQSGTVFSGLAANSYQVTAKNAGECISTITIAVINVQPAALTAGPITGTAIVCMGSTTQLANATAGGTWSVTNGTGAASISTNGVLTGITAGAVTVTYTLTNSCGTSAATRTATVNALSAASISYSVPVTIANQIAALAFNEGTGTAAADISGNNHTGTLTNGPTWIAGRYGQGINMDGVNDYVNIADHANFTLNPAQNYTWSAWVRNNNFNEWGTIWSQTLNATNYFYFYAHTSTDAEAGPVTNGVSVYWYNGANKVVLHSNNNVLTAGTWSNITVTYNGALAQASRFTIYVNGVDVTNRTDVVSTGTLAALDPTNIRMGSNQPYGDYLNAAMDEVRYYNRLLTPAEVLTDMNTAIAPAVGGNGSFCQSGTATVTQTGQTGGVYSGTAGLNINAATGAINLAASTPGNHTVTYSFSNGNCPGTTTASVIIAGLPTSISYTSSTYCQSGTTAATLTGQAGGVYSSTAGLSINGTTGVINLAASTAGTYTVTYSFGSGSCTGTATTSIAIVATLATNISYAGSPYCPTGSATVALTGQTGGSYSSAGGLSINGATGAINLAASTPGTYTVSYSYSNGNCGGTATTSVTIIASPTANISYAGSPYCQTGTATVTQAGQANGTYSSTAGLSINGATGAINLAASTAGTYIVTYNFSNGCPGSTTTSVTIVPILATSISYTGSPFCQSGTATVTQTGQPNGSYSSDAGLSINGATGAINLGASTLGAHTVTYSFSNGNCSGAVTTIVTIVAPPIASISYAGSPYCQSGTATVTQIGQANGTYSSASGLSINGTTGAINLATSTAGTYTVSYNFGSGSCTGVATTSVTINALPTATISYAGNPFCQTGTATVTQNGQANGSYSSAAGLSINAATGAINLAASTPGTYTVTYSISNGGCTGTATTGVIINALPAATISYPVPVATTNQIAALPFNEGTGTAAADISGNNHTGTLTNGPTWIAGRYGQGINCDGVNDYVSIADHANFTLNPAQNYTWSAWVRNTNFNQWGTVWSQTLNATNYFYFYAHTSSDPEAGPVTNGVSVYWYSGTNKVVLHSNNNVLTAGAWSNITVTYNGALAQASRFTIYVNGVDVTNRTDVVSTGTLASLNPTNIRMGGNQPYGDYLNAAMDEVRYYNRLLTPAEVLTDMNTPVAPAVGNGSFCQTGGTATVTRTGQANGTYSSTAGLSIDGATGAINLAASTPGTYTVTYSFTNGTCTGTAITSVSIANCNVLTRVQVQPEVINPKVESPSAKIEVMAYPNPTESFFNLKVRSKSSETVEIRMFDMLGKLVQQQRGAPEQTFRIGDHVVSGMYIIEVRQAGQIVTTKVVKQ